VYLPVSAKHIVKHIDRMLTTTLALGFRVSGLDRQVAHSDLGRPWPAGSALIIHALIYIFARSILHLCSSCKTCKTCVSFNLKDARRPTSSACAPFPLVQSNTSTPFSNTVAASGGKERPAALDLRIPPLVRHSGCQVPCHKCCGIVTGVSCAI
jgi:hypothetical protein